MSEHGQIDAYRNPIVGGDHPDPTILRDGDDFYMTFSPFEAHPGIVIWHSKDLLDWKPLCVALRRFMGSVWAMDLVKHEGRYYIYLPTMSTRSASVFVIWADRIEGPWSEPVDLNLPGCIDPGHAVGEDGKRYLFLNGIRRVPLSDDGLSVTGPLEHVLEPWRYPADWVVEMFAPEGPKVFRRGKWFYLVSAVGGTAGPATSHMVVVSRSESIHGPWEHCPHNPIARTVSEAEPWWSRGHASLVEGFGGKWWMVYHGYENGFRTLGRQTLLEPVRWTEDGWFEAEGGDLSRPLPSPLSFAGPEERERILNSAGTSQNTDTADASGALRNAGFPLSDDFSENRLGLQWSLFDPAPGGEDRVRYVRADTSGSSGCALVLAAAGISPADSAPLTCIVPDRRFCAEVSVTPEVRAGAGVGACGSSSTGCEAGLLLYYNSRSFAGIGFGKGALDTYGYGYCHEWMRVPMEGKKEIRIRVLSVDNVLTFDYALDGGAWVRHPWQMEVSGMNHNTFGGFTSLKLALFCAGEGSAAFRGFQYAGRY